MSGQQADFRLWQEHGYKNGRVVFVSCTCCLARQCTSGESLELISSAMSASIANRNTTQCFYNASKVRQVLTTASRVEDS
jgi:hypothetical protein